MQTIMAPKIKHDIILNTKKKRELFKKTNFEFPGGCNWRWLWRKKYVFGD